MVTPHFIRAATHSDMPAVCAIYNHYIRSSIATFEEEDVTEQEMTARLDAITRTFPWLVHESDEGKVIGYAYVSEWNARSAYRFAAQLTVYLDEAHTGQGAGRALYEALITWLKQRDYRCVMGGISLPNPASVGLHEHLGFEKVAHYKDVGWKFERWIDVGYWQLML
jgi:L-amino acid N-acyltransferase YncA